MSAQVTWHGAEPLRAFLVEIDSLEAFPGNPRRGDVDAVRESMRSNGGQLVPILVDGNRIVSGHARTEAARLEGFTHVAAIKHEFDDEDQARRFLLADNRTHDLGEYELQALVDHLEVLAETPEGIAGTGYDESALNELFAHLATMGQQLEPQVATADRGRREHRDPTVREVVLMYHEEQFAEVERLLGIVARARGTAGTSETVLEGLALAAKTIE